MTRRGIHEHHRPPPMKDASEPPAPRGLGIIWAALAAGLVAVAAWRGPDPLFLGAAAGLLLAFAVDRYFRNARRSQEIQRLQLEAEREEREQKLRRNQKLEAIGKLAGGVAHDFNNLLTVIIGHAGLQKVSLKNAEGSTEHVDVILDAARRAGALTRQLLAFGGRQRFLITDVDVNQLVREMSRMLERLLPETIEVVTELDPQAGSVLADSGQLEQVVMNLVVNSRDALPKGGKIHIRTERHVKPDGSARTALSISDDGLGMSPEVKAHAFDPFFTTKPEGTGTGLGLSTVYGIVKQSGGEVDLQSVEGKGTTVTVLLDSAEISAESSDSGAGAHEAERGRERGSITILLAEDRDDVRSLIERTLDRAGYRVLSASNGNEALQTARKHAAELDLLISDVLMPGMTGPELYGAVKVLSPSASALLISGHAGEALQSSGLDLDATAFLSKPFTSEQLLSKVADVLSAGRRHQLRSVEEAS